MRFIFYFCLPFFMLGTVGPVFANPRFETMLDDLLEGSVAQITTERLAAQLNTDSQQPTVLDARSEKEYAVSHLSGARRIGFRDFSLDRLAGLDKSTPIVVYCSVGKRSEMIGEKLLAAGFSSVHNLRGGIFQWANDGRPLIDANGITKTVHSYNRKWGQWLEAQVPSVQ